MSWYNGLVGYLIIWMAVFFCVLPFGVRTPHEAGTELEPGQAHSAPVRTYMARKLLATTVITAALWGAFYYVAAHDLLGFRDWLERDPLLDAR